MNNKVRTLIVDDEPIARMSLRGLIEECFAHQIEIVGEAVDVPSAVLAIRKQKPDLVLLDVEMPGYSGFELLDFFGNEPVSFKIVFVTASTHHSIRAFEISAIDYILKPAKPESMTRALNKLFAPGFNQPGIEVLRNNLRATNDRERKIVLQTSDSVFVVPLNSVFYLEADGSYTKIHTKDDGTLLIAKRISDFDFLEEQGYFMRVHRSFLINLEKVKRVDKRDFTVVMENGAQVFLAQDRKTALLDRLFG